MATEEKTYLINFEDNLDEYAERAALAAKEVEKLSEENKRLKQSEDATSEEIEKSNAALKNAQTSYRNAQKDVQLVTKANEAHANSYDALYAQWQLAQKQLKKMGDGYTVNEKGVRVLSEEYIKQSKVVADAKSSLDEFGKGINDNRLNVGNYGNAIQEAFGGQLPPAMGQAKSAVLALNAAFKALLSNPIVLIIAAITAALIGLFKAFKSTDEGATQLEARMNQLKAIFDVIRQKAVDMISVLKNIFSGNFKQAADEFKNSVKGIGEQFKDAAQAAYEYTYALDAIKDSQTNFISENARLLNQIAKLEFTAQDARKSISVRRDSIKEAIRLSEELSKKQIQFQDDLLDAEVKNLSQLYGLREADILRFIEMTDEQQKASSDFSDFRNKLNDDDYKKLEELYASRIDLETEYFKKQKENISKLASFEKQAADELAKQKEKSDLDAKRKRAELANAEMQELLDTEIKAAQERQNLAIQNGEKEESIRERILANKLERVKIEQEAEMRFLQENLFGQLEVQKNYLEQQYLQEIDSARKTGADTTNIEAYYADARQKIRMIEETAKLDIASQTANNLATIFGETTAAGKVAAVAATTIETYSAAVKAYSSMSSIPVVGPALGVVAAAAAVAMGLANVKKILSVKTPGSKGGGGNSVSTAATRVTATPLGPSTLTQTQTAQQVASSNTQVSATEDAVTKAVANMPNPVVTVEDIDAKVNEKNKVTVDSTV